MKLGVRTLAQHGALCLISVLIMCVLQGGRFDLHDKVQSH